MDKRMIISLTKEEYNTILKEAKKLNISFSRCVIINALENIKRESRKSC